MPQPIKFDEQWANEEPQDILLDLLEYLSKKGEAFEREARALWEQHLWDCDQGVSTSTMDPSKREEDAMAVGAPTGLKMGNV